MCGYWESLCPTARSVLSAVEAHHSPAGLGPFFGSLEPAGVFILEDSVGTTSGRPDGSRSAGQPWARQFFKQLHGASTLGAEKGLGPGFSLIGCVLVLSEIGEWHFKGRCETEQGFELLKLEPLLGAEEAIVAQLGEAVGQDMLKEAANELFN